MDAVKIPRTMSDKAYKKWEAILDDIAKNGFYEKTIDHNTREHVYLPLF